MKIKRIYLLGIILLCFTSCNKNNKEKIIGEWHREGTFDDGKITHKLFIVLKNDSTFQQVDTLITEDRNDYIKMYVNSFDVRPKDSNSNSCIVLTSNGTWDLRDNLWIFNCKWCNSPTIFKKSSPIDTDRIIKLTEDTIIYSYYSNSGHEFTLTKINNTENNNFLSQDMPSMSVIILGFFSTFIFWLWRRSRNRKIEAEGDERVAQSIAESKLKLCPYCKEEINKDAIKCKHCGEFLDNNKTPS